MKAIDELRLVREAARHAHAQRRREGGRAVRVGRSGGQGRAVGRSGSGGRYTYCEHILRPPQRPSAFAPFLVFSPVCSSHWRPRARCIPNIIFRVHVSVCEQLHDLSEKQTRRNIQQATLEKVHSKTRYGSGRAGGRSPRHLPLPSLREEPPQNLYVLYCTTFLAPPLTRVKHG